MRAEITKSFIGVLLVLGSINLTFAITHTKNAKGFKEQKGNQISFTENKGQVCDQFHNPRQDVFYSGTDGNLVFHLKSNGITYQLNRIDSWKIEDYPGSDNKETAIKVADKSTIYRIDINWLNTNPNAIISEGNTSGEFNNYYLEHCPNGVLNVKNYESVTYQDIYKGISLKWYQHDGHLKYDYLVSAGANYKQIQLEFKGSKNIRLNAKGDLIIKTPLGEIIEQAPLVRQNGIVLNSNWELKENVVSFNIENLDPNLDFIIDPVVRSWGTYYGAAGNDVSYSTMMDASGNVYMAGFANSNVSIATSGAHQTSYGGGTNDAILVKFNALGVRQWGTFYGGGGDDQAYSCATDASGNIYMAGHSTSTTGIASAASHQSVYAGGTSDAFLIKFNSSGVRQWGTYYGGTAVDEALACSVDGSGNVYIAGETNSGGGIHTTGAHQTVFGGGADDAFLAKFNSSGVRQWGTYYGAGGNELALGCTTDGLGNAYLTGQTLSTASISTSGCHQASAGGGGDAFLIKFNSSGVRQWGTYYGGTSAEFGKSCVTDAANNVYLGGYTASSSGTIIATSGSHQTAYGGGSFDAFLVKFNSSGARQWGTYFGGSGSDAGHSCAKDGSNNIYFAGQTTSSNSIASAGSQQTTIGSISVNDAFFVKFNQSGILQWGTYYGGSGNDYGFSCATNGTGTDYYLTGYSNSTTSIASALSHQSTSGGNNDAFLAKFYDCPSPPLPTNTTPGANQTICANNITTLTATGTGTVTWYATITSTNSIASGTSFITSTLSAGTYTFYAENETCAPSATRTAITVTVKAIPTISVNSGFICAGKSFTIIPSGASTYTFEGGSAIKTPTANASYTVIGTSTAGCVSQTAAVSSITVNPNPTITVNNGTICSGKIFTMNPLGAISYTYSSGSNTVTPISNSSYTVTGSNAQGCISSAISSVTVNATPTINVNSAVICSGITFTMLPTGGVNYTYSSGSNTVMPFSNSNYTVTGSSAQGCTNTAISNITVSSAPTITVNSGAICAGNSFTLLPGGASTYTIQGGSAVKSPTANASYTVIGTSTAGCVSQTAAVSNITVNVNPTITVNNGSICSGKIFTMNPLGAISFTYSSGSNTVTPISNSSYTVTGSNAQGCTNSAISSVTVNATPTINVNSGVICSGITFTMLPTGGVNYTFSSGSNTVIPLSNSSYTITGSSAQGCTNTAISNITVNITPTITVNSGAVCAGNSFTIIPGGANTYTFQGGGAVKTPTATSNYTVIGTSASGCVSQTFASSSITVNPNPTISVNSGSICSGNTFTIIPSGAASYTFSSGSSTVAPTVNTNYTLTGSSAQGCTNSAISSVTVNAIPTINVNSGVICSGNTFTIIPGGAVSYTFSNGSNTVIPLNTSSYTVTGTSASGCTNTAISNVTVNTTPTITVSGGAVCPGGSFTLNPSGAATYTYSSGTPVVTPTSTSVYTITGTSLQGCGSAPAFATVVYTNNLAVNIISSNTVCSGQSILLTANGASTYTWNTGVISATIALTPTTNMSYSVVGSSGSCSNSAATTVTVHPLPIVTASASSPVICQGQTATLTAFGAINYTWSLGVYTSVNIITPSTTTTYSVTGNDSNGCVNTAVITQTVEICNNSISYNWNQNTMMKVYPVPTGNLIHVELSTTLLTSSPSNLEFQIINSLGQLLKRQNVSGQDNLISLNDFSAGIYYLILIGDKQQQRFKLIKE
ncbi:MAG: T9SS type A sorting domain-containing protein [Bacteroidia bacterium]|nr:T9SS type A sorting domain-containing protein [Bacteroidia bacterium]